jgi:hypothetical protein
MSGTAGQEHPETQSTASSALTLPPGSAAALTTTAQRAMANPAASRMLAAGIQRAATTGTGRAGGGHAHTAVAVAPLAMTALPSLVGAASSARNNNAAGNNDGHDANANANAPSAGVGVGRVAAAAQAFSSSSPKPANSNTGKLVPQKVESVSFFFRGYRRSDRRGTVARSFTFSFIYLFLACRRFC